MANELIVQIDEEGVHLHRGSARERTFAWTDRRWTLDLRDTRVPRPPQDPISGVPRHHALGKPRITELSDEAAAVDRALLGLAEDPGIDPVLLTNPKAPGELSLHFGPLHVHSASITDAQARSLVRGAVERGFEVRRLTGFAVLPHGGSAFCLVTEITAVPAVGTPEVAP